ncbi:50S ribosomal protein L10 [candidate division WS5 bacterium]|uniref:Large ribosomal subunit protein uL10 n=1 Tax=candidate division WS5 bacterium TaxID=2093353 RepID=A0A419DEF7_9BACT|nr:MAG: 50S ribosomal protein L10 [candidate division WS5 bacterium]
MTRKKKEELVETLAERLEKSKAAVFTDYKGLTVEEINEVRNNLREKGIEFKVIKNTLFGLAVKRAKLDIDPKELANHPVAVAFGYDDEVAPAKVVFNFAKDHESLEIVGGILEGKSIDAASVKSLAQMPSREELIAKMIGSMNAPVSNFVGVMHANLRNVVGVLNAIKEQKA